VIVSYLDHLELRGELDLEVATEFLVLIAALLELKSRLMLPGEEVDPELAGLEPAEAAEELLARLLESHRYRGAAAWLSARLGQQSGYRFRSAPAPRHLRQARLDEAPPGVYDPKVLGKALGGLLRTPRPLDLRHLADPKVSVADRLSHLRSLLRRSGTFSFDEAVADADRMTVAVTLFALLELYKRGEADWQQAEPFAPIEIAAGSGRAAAAEDAA
jgi:segregation and condensation protein A